MLFSGAAIAVSDKDRARKFYQEILELKPSSTQMDGAWVEYDLGLTTIGVGCPSGLETVA
jgi:catechol 2,3-dioxygenase-like lactoylglutathione lyase family enzyme